MAVKSISLTSNTTAFTIGMYTALKCVATGRPMPFINWFKNNLPLQIDANMKFSFKYNKSSAVTTAILVFSPLKINDSGIYQCIANDTRHSSSVSSKSYYISKSFNY